MKVGFIGAGRMATTIGRHLIGAGHEVVLSSSRGPEVLAGVVADLGTRDTQALHRIDPASVREEVEAAGFVLDAQSTMLANKDDPHSIKVFDPAIKGETDRFAYRFVKP